MELRDSVEADAGEHIDADVSIKMTEEPAEIQTGPTDAAEGPKDADMGSLSAAKQDLLPMIEGQLRGAMRRQGVDAKAREIEDMAECLCSLAAVDVAEIFTPPRCTPKAHLYGL